ncbi:MAG: hypothetical protein A2086_12315 [Spirochaetes bacterium GWD1_27_9]|nr:MAG: hypothetical protein A2Z98_01040 [Spirochaetes bacterium GWB1_27_13]OHD25873.1 MAG: hypothetical protein A2Y34_15340 [Spirochaetes bacterium GWC1_27_15]OHD34417.1 MAG: hypothetical protein A2086_12315 [Spirochaetes bacterium GWD1_27_9]
MKKLKEILKKILEEENNISSVEVSGSSLEEVLQSAASQLGVSLAELDYEIESFGSKGILGVGKKDFKIKVYKSRSVLDAFQSFETENFEDAEELGLDIEENIKDKDGEAFLRVVSKGVLLKITPPVGSGKPISESEVYNIVSTRGLQNFDKDLIKKIIKYASAEYCRIGELPINVVNDSTASVQISSDEMKAFLILTPPKTGGFDLENDDINNILKSNGVVVGIKTDILNKLIDYPQYNEPILIAEGIKVKNGQDAEVHYNFNVNKDEIHLTEEDGKVDFKNLNIIQNVVAGQILANKEPSTRGESGRTVTNKLIMPKEGKDCSLVAGKNTHLTDDGLSIIAEKNGQVMLFAGKVTVEEIYTVAGDVNLKTGNVTFLGTVVVQGNVEDGFSVKASANIEVHGSVGKCVLEADGDIIISQGFMGKAEGTIRAGKSVYAKFIENAKKVDAYEGVYVQDGIMNSYIDATKEITCVGKRGTIVGGRLRSGELVKSKTLGSNANVFTIIEVGIDPKKRQRLEELNEERDKAYKEKEPLDANIANLENLRKANKLINQVIEVTSFSAILKRLSDEDKKIMLSYYEKDEEGVNFLLKEDLSQEEKKKVRDAIAKVGYLPAEKEEIYLKLQEQANKLLQIIKQAEEEIEEIEKYLAQLKSSAKVIGSKIVYPGVKLYIKNAFLEIKTEYKKVSFYIQGTEINVAPYAEEEKEGRR